MIKKIDFTNSSKLLDLMANSEKYDTVIMGENQDGEFIMTEIYPDRIKTETLQKNGWTRSKVYWKDGTIEEIYSK